MTPEPPAKKEKSECFTIRIPKAIKEPLGNYLLKKTGLTINQVLQLVAFVFLEPATADDDIPQNQKFAKELETSLAMYAAALGRSRKPERSAINGQPVHVIAIHAGHVITCHNAPPKGSFRLGRDNALKAILESDSQLYSRLQIIMQYRGTNSIYKTLEDIMDDIINLHLLQTQSK